MPSNSFPQRRRPSPRPHHGHGGSGHRIRVLYGALRGPYRIYFPQKEHPRLLPSRITRVAGAVDRDEAGHRDP
ncbi:hypothetical protein PR202_gb18680 [Eleusine coracana subsp. coracana]|uniref:Uncharacterized protein n=1 Tax=Eleusine coracana subsp. coracana TaxID=191504 RepID=A0AAV5F678_ELECO|nr:hypothetical protein PR202_gb18680 [Eleusine coracana subsp. coracana]